MYDDNNIKRVNIDGNDGKKGESGKAGVLATAKRKKDHLAIKTYFKNTKEYHKYFITVKDWEGLSGREKDGTIDDRGWFWLDPKNLSKIGVNSKEGYIGYFPCERDLNCLTRDSHLAKDGTRKE